LPVAVENDANLGALGEAIKGAGQGHSLLLQVTAGYGIGCGIVHDGRIFGGAFGTAGELGHVIVNPHDERSDDDAGGCGMRGCLQAVAGGKAISDSVRGKVGKYLTLRRIIDEAEPGMGAKSDPVARACQEAVREASGHLGRTVAGICSILNPDCVVLSGGLSAAGTVALSPFRTALETYVLKCSIPSTVVATALGGPPRSELIGAWAHLLGSEHALARLEAEILGRDPE
jgi:predicted NBD/HSP70 family sugar kinase